MMRILGTMMSKVLGKAPALPSAPAPAASPPPPGPVDVAAVLDALSAKKTEKLGEKLDWRHSTVDLMRVLSVDSSVLARQELAKELQYNGDIKNSAAVDIWLHEQIVAILAANGGKLPIALRRKWYLSHYGP